MKAYVTLGELFSEPDDLLMRCKIALLWFDNLLIQSFPNNFYVDYLLEEIKYQISMNGSYGNLLLIILKR